MVRTKYNAAAMHAENNMSITPMPIITSTTIFSPTGSAEVGTPINSDIKETKVEEMKTESRVTRSKKHGMDFVQDAILEGHFYKHQTITNHLHIAIEVKAKNVKVRNCISYKQLN